MEISKKLVSDCEKHISHLETIKSNRGGVFAHLSMLEDCELRTICTIVRVRCGNERNEMVSALYHYFVA